MRILFVDHEPTELMVESMSSLIEKMSLLNGGRIPEFMNTITVFPTDSTGPQVLADDIGMARQNPAAYKVNPALPDTVLIN